MIRQILFNRELHLLQYRIKKLLECKAVVSQQQIAIFSIRQNMEAYRSKWKHLHESAKTQANAPISKIERFRSTSRDKQSYQSQLTSVKSIGELVPNVSGKDKSGNDTLTEYYEVRGRQGKKESACEDQVKVLKKKLRVLGENKPQDKQTIDQTILILSKYQQTIESLKAQNSQLTRQLAQLKKDPILESFQNDLKHSPFSSQKTVSSQPSNSKLPPASNSCTSSSYFSMFSLE